MAVTYPIDDPLFQTTVVELVTLTLHLRPNEIQPTTPLFAGDDGFDSFGLMEFILRLEEVFSLSIPDEHLDPDTFFSVETIQAYLRQRLGGE